MLFSIDSYEHIQENIFGGRVCTEHYIMAIEVAHDQLNVLLELRMQLRNFPDTGMGKNHIWECCPLNLPSHVDSIKRIHGNYLLINIYALKN